VSFRLADADDPGLPVVDLKHVTYLQRPAHPRSETRALHRQRVDDDAVGQTQLGNIALDHARGAPVEGSGVQSDHLNHFVGTIGSPGLEDSLKQRYCKIDPFDRANPIQVGIPHGLGFIHLLDARFDDPDRSPHVAHVARRPRHQSLKNRVLLGHQQG